MLNDFRPELGGADAHSFYDSSTAGQAVDLPTSPAEHPVRDASPRAPLPTSLNEVAKIWQLLNEEGFIALKKSNVVGHRAAYWMALLTLFTDMTVAELARLRPSDFAWASCAGHLIRRPPSKLRGGQLHPVHEVLIQGGFLDFIAERWEAKAAHLFSDSTKTNSSPRAAMRHVSKVWSGAGEAVPAPSWNDFRAARRFEAEKVLAEYPQLLERLEARQDGVLPPVDEMQLVLDLEQALQYDEVDWSHHYADSMRFDG